MKLCTCCGVKKSLDEFSWKNKSKGIKSSHCKSCHSQYSKQHYRNNVDVYVAKAKVSTEKAIQANRDFLRDYLKSHPCVDCGYSDIRALQFDHIEMLNSAKSVRVPNLIKGSLDRIKEELSKCEVRCANCHMIRTRRQLGWNHYDPDHDEQV